MARLSPRQARFLDTLDRAIQNGGRIHTYKAVQAGGWFYPSDVMNQSGPVCAQLFERGIFERKDVGLLSTRYIYRKVPA